MTVNTCVDSCNHHHNQDTEQFHHPPGLCGAAPSTVTLAEDSFDVSGGEKGVKTEGEGVQRSSRCSLMQGITPRQELGKSFQTYCARYSS